MRSALKTREKQRTAERPTQGWQAFVPEPQRKLKKVGPGRPTKFCEAVVEEICERIVQGEALTAICQDEHLPCAAVVQAWLNSADQDKCDFQARYARARIDSAEAMDSRILRTIDKVEAGMDPHAAKVIIAALQWRAAKLNQKRYGDKLEVEQTVTVDLGNMINEARRRAALRAGSIDTTARTSDD